MPADTAETFRQFVTNSKIETVLRDVAQSIKIAHAADPSKWGLRVNQTDLMLKVGFVEVLQAGDGWFHLLVKEDFVPQKLKSDRRLSFSDYFPYKNAPGCVSCDLKALDASRAYRALLPAHEAALRTAARSRRHTSTTKDHSSKFITFLTQELHELLPQPAYYESRSKGAILMLDEMPGGQGYEEGAVVSVLVNRYERDPTARERCVSHYGAICVVCRVSLADRYGPEVNGLIRVHHLKPLSSVGKTVVIDPVRDLRPVCPNCHAVIHTTNPPRTIDQVRRMFQKKAGRCLSEFRECMT